MAESTPPESSAGSEAIDPAAAGTSRAQPGWREVLSVAAAIVLVVLGAAVVTGVLPRAVQEVIFHTPIAIAVLVGGTAWVLWQIGRRPASG